LRMAVGEHWRKNMRLVRLMAAGLCVSIASAVIANAQPYPSRIIKLIVPYPPGGVVDITGRLLANQLQKELSATVIVENKPGAGGTLGANFVAKAEPDGYIILLSGAATHAFAPSLFKNLPYDPIADFVPITQISEGPLGLAVSADSGINDLAGFVAAMTAKGGSSNYASNGHGTYPHLAMELLKQKAGFAITHVPFRGGNEAVTALLGGQVQVTLNHLPVVLPQADAGKLRLLATSGGTRAQALPGIPSLKERGYDVVASAWFGLFAPARTPRNIIDQISAAVVRAAQSPLLKEKLLAQGDEIRAEGPDKFLAHQRGELAKWTGVIANAGIELN
jgi:tripartite-type tricarboxylate transporter receptor subunit TctC